MYIRTYLLALICTQFSAIGGSKCINLTINTSAFFPNKMLSFIHFRYYHRNLFRLFGILSLDCNSTDALISILTFIFFVKLYIKKHTNLFYNIKFTDNRWFHNLCRTLSVYGKPSALTAMETLFVSVLIWLIVHLCLVAGENWKRGGLILAHCCACRIETIKSRTTRVI